MSRSSPCPDENAIQQFVDGSIRDRASEEIEAHLGGCAACRALLLALATSATASTVGDPGGPPAPREARAPLARGASVGRYLILDRLGQGGMGVVYSAYDPQLDRRVALKLIRSDPRGGRAVLEHLRTRLLREAQAMARLGHPNVVAVHDVGTRDDEVFVAMELVDGETLASWLRTPRTSREIIGVFVAAGRGLEAAHAAGMVHRDFKPDNVLIGRDGRVRVGDFGLARAIAGDDDELADRELRSPIESPATPLPAVTETGVLVGTPDYMAPEQLLLRATDARCDQFAFCLALWEALAGERPFAGLPVDARLRAITLGPPRAGRRIGARIARALARGLRLEPDARWDSMTSLLATIERAARPRWRRAAPVAGAIAVVAAAVAIAGARARTDRPAPPLCEGAADELARVWSPARRAALGGGVLTFAIDRFGAEWIAMDRESCRATRVLGTQSEELLDLRTQCLHDALAAVDDTIDLATRDPRIAQKAPRVADSLPSLDACADLAALRAGPQPPRDPAARARLEQQRSLLARARVLASAGEPGNTLALATEVAAVAAAERAPDLEADADDQAARAAIELGLSEQTLPILDRAARGAVEARRDDLLASTLLERCYVIGYVRNDPKGGMPWCDLAEDVIARLPHPLALERRRWRMVGAVADAASDLPAVERAARMELALVPPLDPAQDEMLADSYLDLGNALGRKGEHAAAVAAYDHGIAIHEALGSRGMQESGVPYFDRALDLAELGRDADAEADLRRAIAIDERTLSPGHPDTVGARIALGDLLDRDHHYDDAAALLAGTLPLAEKVRVEDDVGVPDVLRLWAVAEAGRGDLRRAHALIDRWRRETGKPLPAELRAIR